MPKPELDKKKKTVQYTILDRYNLVKQLNKDKTKSDMECAARVAKLKQMVSPKLPQMAIDMANGKNLKPYRNFNAALDATVALIAQSEDFVAVPEKWKDGHWYVGFGCGWHPSGRRVRPTDRINSKEEAIQYTRKALEENYKYLDQYLPLDKMTKDEIAAFNSLVYNAGHTVLGSDGKPSKLVSAFCKWKESGLARDKEAVRLLYKNTRVYSSGKLSSALQKRRDLEARILLGDIKIDNSGKSKDPRAIDLDNVTLAALYSIGPLPKDSVQLVKKLEAYRAPKKKSLAQMFDKAKKKTAVNVAAVRKKAQQGRA